MAEPWQCPACKTWLAPHVSEHRCDPEGGVPAVPVPPAPLSPVTTASNVTLSFTGTMPMAAGRLPTLIYQRRNPGLTLRVA
jgi:hypothetical protein